MKRFASGFPTSLALQYAHMYTDLKDIISIDFSVQGIVIMHIGILEKLKMCRDTIKEKITHIFTTKQSVQKPKQFKLKVLDHPLYSQIRHFQNTTCLTLEIVDFEFFSCAREVIGYVSKLQNKIWLRSGTWKRIDERRKLKVFIVVCRPVRQKISESEAQKTEFVFCRLYYFGAFVIFCLLDNDR